VARGSRASGEVAPRLQSVRPPTILAGCAWVDQQWLAQLGLQRLRSGWVSFCSLSVAFACAGATSEQRCRAWRGADMRSTVGSQRFDGCLTSCGEVATFADNSRYRSSRVVWPALSDGLHASKRVLPHLAALDACRSGRKSTVGLMLSVSLVARHGVWAIRGRVSSAALVSAPLVGPSPFGRRTQTGTPAHTVDVVKPYASS